MSLKKKSKVSLAAKSLKWLRDQGYTAECVSYWHPFARIRKDLFHFGDILCFAPGSPGTVEIIQVTSRSNVSTRFRKIQESRIAKDWIRTGYLISVHGWDKKDNRWRMLVHRVLLPDF